MNLLSVIEPSDVSSTFSLVPSLWETRSYVARVKVRRAIQVLCRVFGSQIYHLSLQFAVGYTGVARYPGPRLTGVRLLGDGFSARFRKSPSSATLLGHMPLPFRSLATMAAPNPLDFRKNPNKKQIPQTLLLQGRGKTPTFHISLNSHSHDFLTYIRS